MMVGFRAVAESDEVTVDEDELLEARWFTRDEVLDLLAVHRREGWTGRTPSSRTWSAPGSTSDNRLPPRPRPVEDRPMGRGFDELVTEAAAGADGRLGLLLAGRPRHRGASAVGLRAADGRADGPRAVALDVQTGGGEVLATAPRLAPVTVATEGWPPNLARAAATLHPRGVTVVADRDEPPLPFADGVFDLVVSRHPVHTWWAEIARVLAPGGTYLSQGSGRRACTS